MITPIAAVAASSTGPAGEPVAPAYLFAAPAPPEAVGPGPGTAPAARGGISARIKTWAVRLDTADRTALGYWLAAHAVLFTLAYAAAWIFSAKTAHLPLASGYQQWDANLLADIAAHGYYGPGSVPNNAAFFPGYPLALTAVHLAVRNWIASELLLSLVAGCVVVVSLARLAGSSRAALYLLTAPTAVFLAVGYSEPVYLACAIPAWNAARRGAWRRCGLYTFLAAFTRPDGLFLIPALVVMALTRPQGSRWRALFGVAPGLLAPVLYGLYLYIETNRWSAWGDANQAGWGLHYVGPWQALKTSYWGAFEHPYSAEFGFLEQLEIACLAVMLAAAVGFLVRRRWPEAVYCALAVLGLGTQTWYQSVPRTLLVMFPVWVALARFTRNRPWAAAVHIAVSGSLAVVLALLYLGGQWAG